MRQKSERDGSAGPKEAGLWGREQSAPGGRSTGKEGQTVWVTTFKEKHLGER